MPPRTTRSVHRALWVLCLTACLPGCGSNSQQTEPAPIPENLGNLIADAQKQGGSTTIVGEPGKGMTTIHIEPAVTPIRTDGGAVGVQTTLNTSAHDGKVEASQSVVITLPEKGPPDLTRALYDRIEPGMEHAQVSALFGGDDALNCHVKSSFTGDFTIRQGKRSVTLKYQSPGPKVASKSQQGLE